MARWRTRPNLGKAFNKGDRLPRGGAEQAMVFIRLRRNLVACSCAVVGILLVANFAHAIAPGTPGPGDVHFTINSAQSVKAKSARKTHSEKKPRRLARKFLRRRCVKGDQLLGENGIYPLEAGG